MIAEQNHPAKVIQLALLPWEVLFLMRSWKTPRNLVGLGIVLGISFLAGQPQIFFDIAFFLGCFSLSETIIRWKESGLWRRSGVPVLTYVGAMSIATGIAAIQLLPSLELANHSARIGLSYSDASHGGIHLGYLINFIVPKLWRVSWIYFLRCIAFS
jgi:hypothetical protein